MDHKQILNDVRSYYTEKLKTYGATPQGVDWNSEESQELRFEQLSKIIIKKPCSVLDFGSGFGAMYSWFKKIDIDVRYFGYDISEEMVSKGRELHAADGNCEFGVSIPDKKFDYVIASGIFNVKLDTDNEEWLKYIVETLEVMNDKVTKGFAFNMLTSYSDKPFMKDNLYYGDPLLFFDYCKTRFSKHVALLHDYPLYEFTILVRKEL